MKTRAPGHDEFRCVPVLTSRSVVVTIIGIRLLARRYDCSFVLAVLCRLRWGDWCGLPAAPYLGNHAYKDELEYTEY
jgi:siroheme synthase